MSLAPVATGSAIRAFGLSGGRSGRYVVKPTTIVSAAWILLPAWEAGSTEGNFSVTYKEAAGEYAYAYA